MKDPSLLIIIPEYRERDFTKKCVASILAQDLNVKIAVGNDGDNDLTNQPIKGAVVVDFHDNVGYTKNVNRTFKWAIAGHELDPPEYLLLSNNDCVYPPGSIEKLMEVASTGALAGPHLTGVKLGGDKNVQYSNKYKRGLVLVTTLSGCALMLQTKAWLDLKGLDEDFYIYFSDDDLCIRATNKGIPVVYLPGATVIHTPRTTIEKTFTPRQVSDLFKRDSAIFNLKYQHINHDMSGEYEIKTTPPPARHPVLEGGKEPVKLLLKTRQSLKGRGCCSSPRDAIKFYVLTANATTILSVVGPFHTVYKALKACGKWSGTFKSSSYNDEENLQILYAKRVIQCPNEACKGVIVL